MTYERWLQLWQLVMDDFFKAAESGTWDEIQLFEAMWPDRADAYEARRVREVNDWAHAQIAVMAAQ